MTIEEQSYQNIIAHLNDGLYFVDTDRRITYWNKAAEEITGFSAQEVVGRCCHDNILNHVDAQGRSLCLGVCPLAHTISDGEFREGEVFLRQKDGTRIKVLVRTSVIRDDHGKVLGGAELFSDISKRDAANKRIEELEKMALVDGLTRLPNRLYIDNELEKRLAEFDRMNIPFGILFIDVDHFKRVNDRHGHEMGDEVLMAVARTMTATARPFDVYGRWGGEEFLGIIPNISLKDLGDLGERLRLLVKNTYIMNHDEPLGVTISLGATVYRKGEGLKAMIKRADELMYRSKEGGRDRISLG